MSAKPTRRRRSLGALVAVCLAVLLSAVPGVAAAKEPTVTPVLDCYRLNSDGTVTAVLGYVNPTAGTTTIPPGPRNLLTPAKFQGSQPTTFLPGTQRGVFTLTLAQADLASEASWALDGTTLNYRDGKKATQCSPSTPLPAIGNGTGLAVALVGGGAFGVFFVRRLVRRSSAAQGGRDR